ncbi:hypothetical protein GCM10009102_05500 [Sphingomonas insulae]|uniref:Uncharacterized protein n=1 Tax=Sphingomonas insulae TaxID=424800 RepID=A0ABN1HMZ0_9SPHN
MPFDEGGKRQQTVQIDRIGVVVQFVRVHEAAITDGEVPCPAVLAKDVAEQAGGSRIGHRETS